jgi:basic membrane lipoprotein Med (substrate-binding protein (PBP1-ABC) superfamily)
MKKWTLFLLICSIAMLGFSANTVGAEDKKIKAGFIYVGPVGDYGFSHAHDLGRKFAEKKLAAVRRRTAARGNHQSAPQRRGPADFRRTDFRVDAQGN